MKIPSDLNLHRGVGPRKVGAQNIEDTLVSQWRDLAHAMNGHVSFGDGINGVSDNIDGTWVNVTFAAANTDQTVNHNLNRLPSAYFVARKSAACDIFDGTVAATKTAITLQSTVAPVTVRLFIV